MTLIMLFQFYNFFEFLNLDIFIINQLEKIFFLFLFEFDLLEKFFFHFLQFFVYVFCLFKLTLKLDDSFIWIKSLFLIFLLKRLLILRDVFTLTWKERKIVLIFTVRGELLHLQILRFFKVLMYIFSLYHLLLFKRFFVTISWILSLSIIGLIEIQSGLRKIVFAAFVHNL